MQLKIDGFRNLEHFDETLPEDNVIVLRGRNGAGKSTIQRVMRRLLGDTTTTPEKARGVDKATASLTHRGQKISLTFAAKFSPTGKIPARLAANEGRLLSDLIGPPDDDVSKGSPARKDRVAALAKLAFLTPTPETISSLVGSTPVPAAEWKDPSDFMSVVGELKRRLEAEARKHEADRDRADGQITLLRRASSAIPTEAKQPPPRQAEAVNVALDLARREQYKLEASHKARLEQEQARAKLRADLPAPTWQALLEPLEILRTRLQTDAPIAVTDAGWRETGMLTTRLGAAVTATERATAIYRQTQVQLAAPITGATEAEVAASWEAVTKLEAELKTAVDHARWLELETEHTIQTTRLETAAAQAGAYRCTATGIAAKIADMIRAANLETLSLDAEGEVVANTGTGWVPFAGLSFGERVYHAISALVSAEHLTPEGDETVFLVLSPTFWGALDSTAQGVVRMDLARYNGQVILLTEAPDDSQAGITI